MKYSLLCILSLISFWENSLAQKEDNIWYFGNQAGLDFSSGSPVALTNGALFTYDNSSTVSDSAGNLLFYTNGVTVWNKNHLVMANGTGLMGNNSGGQSALIVRQPNSQLYYVFTTDAFDGPNGFRYSTVDMSLNGGLGGVVLKNNLLFTPSTEKIDGIYNCGDNSFWVVAHEWNSNQFDAYKLSSTGLNTTPVTSNIGSVNSGGNPSGYNSLGQMTLSKDGTKLVCGIYSMGNIEIFDFDMNTGIISNPIIITGYSKIFGVAFSPDANRLYITQWYGADIIQFDITLGTSSAIASSAAVVGTVTGPGTSGYYAGYLQLAPDDKIYAAVYDDTYLAVINNSNALGTGCNFVDNGVYLGGKTSLAGLSRVVAVNNISNYSISSQNFCLGGQTIFSLSDTSQIISCNWNFGDTASGVSNVSSLLNPPHVFSSSGNFSIQAIISADCDIDTSYQTITINPLPTFFVTGNIPACSGDTIFLNASGATGNPVYQWNNGDNDSATTATSGGTYVVTVTNSTNCSAVDSSVVNIFPASATSVTSTICSGDSIFLQGNYQTASGIYHDTLSTVNSCDSVIATTLTVSNFLYGSLAIAICNGDSIFAQGAYQNTSGNYNDTLTSTGICDSIITTVLTVHPAATATATAAICTGDSIFLQGNYQTNAGTYYDTLVSASGCDSVITTMLAVNQSPAVAINSSSATIYSGENATLSASSQASGVYTWLPASDLSCTACQNTIANPAQTTIYHVTLTALDGCTGMDSITVFVEGSCGTLSIPNIFSPNGDGRNDILYVHGTCIKSLSFSIYDRWGEKVFETNDKNIGWDGNYNGNALSSAVFAYLVKATFVNNAEKSEKGNITLIR